MAVRWKISFRECGGHLVAVEVIHALANRIENFISIGREHESFVIFRLGLRPKEYLHSRGLEVFRLIICHIIPE